MVYHATGDVFASCVSVFTTLCLRGCLGIWFLTRSFSRPKMIMDISSSDLMIKVVYYFLVWQEENVAITVGDTTWCHSCIRISIPCQCVKVNLHSYKILGYLWLSKKQTVSGLVKKFCASSKGAFRKFYYKREESPLFISITFLINFERSRWIGSLNSRYRLACTRCKFY